jgi:WD40-like Beta Propeller Repeat
VDRFGRARLWTLLAAAALAASLALSGSSLASARTATRLVVFTQYSDNGPGEDDNATLYVARLGSRAARQLTDSCVDCSDHARWSPDGSTIAYQSVEPAFGIYLIRPDGTRRRLWCAETMSNQQCEDVPAWSPDGREIAFSLARRGIGVKPTAGGAVRRVPHSSTYSVTDLDWSPDGKQLAFEVVYRAVDGIRLDGSWRRRIASDVAHPRWSPEGTRLLFTSRVRLASVHRPARRSHPAHHQPPGGLGRLAGRKPPVLRGKRPLQLRPRQQPSHTDWSAARRLRRPWSLLRFLHPPAQRLIPPRYRVCTRGHAPIPSAEPAVDMAIRDAVARRAS